MKVKNFNCRKFNLFFVQFLKHKTYKVNKTNYRSVKYYFNQFILQKIYLKSILNIIFYYNLMNKKIIFLGNFYLYYKKLLNLFKQTNHFFIPTFLYKSDFLTNKVAFYRYLKFNKFKNKNFILNLLIKNPFDLIVILNRIPNNFNVKTFFKLNIPVVSLYVNLKKLYNIKFSNLFILFLSLILNKIR